MKGAARIIAAAALACLCASHAPAETAPSSRTQSPSPARPSSQAVPEDIEIGLSTEKIAITSNFVGTDLTIFGALDNADAQMEKQGRYDIVVALVGPSQTVVVRRKSRVLGIWANTASMIFGNVPASYSLASTRSLAAIANQKTYRQLGLGVDYLSLQPVLGVSPIEHHVAFSDALRAMKLRQGMYVERVGDVQLISPTLFRATLTIPANVPIGTHKAEAFLFRDGVFIRETSANLQIVKSGFENAVYDYAHRYGLLYGLFSVALAIVTGWAGRIVFRRD